MNRTFLIIVLVGSIALYLFWDEIVARRNKATATSKKEFAAVTEYAKGPVYTAYASESIKHKL